MARQFDRAPNEWCVVSGGSKTAMGETTAHFVIAGGRGQWSVGLRLGVAIDASAGLGRRLTISVCAPRMGDVTHEPGAGLATS